MDPYSGCADLCHQGYPQAPPPGTAPVQVPPPAPSPASVSTPLAPPGVVPSPSPTPATYYGAYPPQPDNWNAHPVPADPPQIYYDNWNAYPMPAEPRPHVSYEKWNAYPVPVEPLPHNSYEKWNAHPMPAEPLPHIPYDKWNAYPMPTEPPPHVSYPPNSHGYSAYSHHSYYQETFPNVHGHLGPPQAYMCPPPRGSDVTRFRKKRHLLTNQSFLQKSPFYSDSRAYITPLSSYEKAKNAHSYHPSRQRRVDVAPAQIFGKKRKKEEIGDRGLVSTDGRREGDKVAGRNSVKSKRKKGRKLRAEGGDMDINTDAGRARSGKKDVDADCEGTPLTDEQTEEATTWLALHRDVHKRVQNLLHALDNGVSVDAIKKSTESAIQRAEGEDQNVVIQGKQEALEDKPCTYEGADVDEKAHAALVVDVVNPRAVQADAVCAGKIPGIDQDETKEQQSAILLPTQKEFPELLQGALQSLDSGTLLTDGVNRNIEDPKSAWQGVQQLATELLQDTEQARVGEPALSIQVIIKAREQNPLIESVENVHIAQKKHQDSSEEDEAKDREEKCFVFFTSLLEENVALRKLYVDKCNDGAFECLMCHNKMKKYSSIASLVSHANNVLKTKRLPEHRGYGRAVCCLFGWDPCKIPSVPMKSTLSKPIVHMAIPEIAAVVDMGSKVGQVDDLAEEAVNKDVKSVLVADFGIAPVSLAVSCTFEQGKQVSELDKVSLKVDDDVCAAANISIPQAPLTNENEACCSLYTDMGECVNDIHKELSTKGQNDDVEESGVDSAHDARLGD